MVLFAATALYLLYFPVPIRPEVWQPPPSPALTGVLAINDHLAHGQRIASSLEGPEAVAFDAEGRIVTGLLDGRIVRIEGDRITTLAQTGGRPLGIAFDAEGRMVVADAYRGLLRVDGTGRVETLATTHGGRVFGFTDDVVIAADGTIYFTDASSRFQLPEYQLDILEHGAHGRVLAYHPADGRVEAIADGLHFANGIALTPDGAALIVAETSSYKVVRISLAEADRGRVTTFADGLPGFPDNVRYDAARDVYWVAIGSPRNPRLDAMADSPFLRRVVARLPKFLQPHPEPHAMVIALSAQGRIVHALHHVAANAYTPIASVVEREGYLYLGSFRQNGLVRVRAPR